MSRRGTRREYQAGRLPIKIYEYSMEGKYIGSYNCINDYRTKYYPDDAGKRPLFINRVNQVDYDISPENTIVFKQRVYRDVIKYYLKIINSLYCNFNNTNNRKIEVINLKGEVLAEFANANVAKHMLRGLLPDTTIASQISKSTTVLSKFNSELICRYKQEEND